MNALFCISVIVLLVGSMIADYKHLAERNTGMRWLYGIFSLSAAALFLAIIAGYDIPMPTQFFINHVSPWVFNIIHPK
jgi:hypothetical protein